ncbi:hypothetical protein KVR01_002672 [Diaporthe batatas]|uniref:uncharacterized protein n=1 Tax=Diaporthe batatas TaxID=748121 RepID=UPI001D04E4FC|nr:uncharacterized protein KVR01_002672 [Diaporthe batatas]KAG8166983.1 hypothetical protein KVR01_002672 [Diaporthe batatas]
MDLVSLLIDHGAEVNATDSNGLTLMHLVPAGRSDIVGLLVRSGLAIDIKDSNGNSGLMLAVLQGQAERVRTYLLNGADVNAAEPIPASIKLQSDTVLPPILIAVLKEKTSVLKALVEHGADLRPKFSVDGMTALHEAASRHMHEAIRCLITAKVDLEVRDADGDTALHSVAMAGDGPHSDISFKLLLDAGADIEARDLDGFTPLHAAAQKGVSTVVQRLLDSGSDIEARSSQLRTPLHQAAEYGHTEIIQRLLNKGADIHSKDRNGETALHVACRTRCDKNLSVIKYLIACGASVLEPTTDVARRRLLPAHYAANFGFKEAVELFLNMGFESSSTDGHGLQMIHHAASKGHVDVLKLLLSRNAAASSGTRTGGERPLHFAARGDHEEAVSVLCKYGADANLPAWKDGCYPIHFAAQCGHDKVISVLRKNGAKIDVLDDQKGTALFHAARGGHKGTVSLLCDHGAQVNLGSCNALISAGWQGRADIVSVLCERGASVHINRHTRMSPLIEAAKAGHIDVVRILLQYGADVDVRSKNLHWTPLHFAAYNNRKEMLKLFLEKGADRQALTKGGETAWALAQKMGHGEMCQMLGRPSLQGKADTGGRTSDPTTSKKVVPTRKKTPKK